MKPFLSVTCFALFIISSHFLRAQSYERAVLFKEHRLTEDAKRELILIITSKSDDATKAKSYYLLGAIAFDESRVIVEKSGTNDSFYRDLAERRLRKVEY